MATRGKGPPSDGVMKAPNTQTDLDQTQITPAAAAPTAESTQSPQTDPVLKVPPRKRVSRADIVADTVHEEPKPEQETPDQPVPRTRIKMEMPIPNTEVLAIDDTLGVQTEFEKARDKFLDLVESLKTGRYLTDIVQGVEKHSDGGMPRAVIFHGDYKVIIMASMLVDLPRNLRDLDPNEMYSQKWYN